MCDLKREDAQHKLLLSLCYHGEHITVYTVHSSVLGTCLSENSKVNVFPLELIKEDLPAVGKDTVSHPALESIEA